MVQLDSEFQKLIYRQLFTVPATNVLEFNYSLYFLFYAIKDF